DDDLAEVVGRPQRVRREDPDLDEVREVAELVERAQLLDRRARQCVVVSLRDLEQGLRPDRAFEVDVQLDLREWRHCQPEYLGVPAGQRSSCESATVAMVSATYSTSKQPSVLPVSSATM